MSRRTELTWLAGLLAVGLAARLILVSVVDPSPKLVGGDGPFYLTVAQNLANGYGFVYGKLATYKTEPVITAGPLYPAYLSAFYLLFRGQETHPIHDPPVPLYSAAPWIAGARLGQAVIGALTIAVVYAFGRRLWSARAGLIAAGILALDLRFIVETGAIYTETLFTFLLLSGLLVYVAAHQRSDTRLYALAWLVLGLATLTRPTALALFPALCLHVWLSRPRSQAFRQTGLMVAMLGLVFGPWFVGHYLLYGDFKIIGSSAASHFWLGAIRNGQWEGLDDFAQQRLAIVGGDPNNPPYLRVALAVIAEHPLRFAQLLGLKLVRGYAQPFGAASFPGPGLKVMVADALAGRVSMSSLVSQATFWPKAIIYLFHFGTIGLGLAGMWQTRRRWRDTLPPILAIAAVTGTYALLTMIPRYIFPIMPCITLFAAEIVAVSSPRRILTFVPFVSRRIARPASSR